MSIHALKNPVRHLSEDNHEDWINPPDIIPDHSRSVFVLYTSASGTLKAVEKARELADPFWDSITVLAIQTVPYAVPLEYPPVSTEFMTQRFSELFQKFSETIQIRALLCRNRMESIKQILNLNTPIVIAAKKRWLPTAEGKLARALCRAGYMVVLVDV